MGSNICSQKCYDLYKDEDEIKQPSIIIEDEDKYDTDYISDEEYMQKYYEEHTEEPEEIYLECPSNSRGLNAEEKQKHPGYYCMCISGFGLDKSSLHCVKWNYSDVTKRTKTQLLEIYEPILTVSEYDCFSNSYKIYENFCACDTNYIYNNDERSCIPEALEIPDIEPIINENIADVEEKSTNIKSTEIELPPDVPMNAWYIPALSALMNKSLISEYLPFRAYENAKRHEVVDLIIEIQGGYLHQPPFQPSFDDVPFTTAYNPSFEIAATKGWLTGDNNCLGKHPCYARPEQSINRAEVAMLLVRAFDLMSDREAPVFEDATNGMWYTEPVRTAASYCILQGDSGANRVRPADTMNRSEMVTMIWRASQNLRYPNCH